MIIVTPKGQKNIEIEEKPIKFERFKKYMTEARNIEKISPGDDGTHLTDVEFIITAKNGRKIMLDISSYEPEDDFGDGAIDITEADVTDLMEYL